MSSSLAFKVVCYLLLVCYLAGTCFAAGRIYTYRSSKPQTGSFLSPQQQQGVGQMQKKTPAISDDPLISKFWEHIKSGNDRTAVELLRMMMVHDRDERFKNCMEKLSLHICRNINSQPFFLWAKVAAQDMTKDRLSDLKDKLLMHKPHQGPQ